MPASSPSQSSFSLSEEWKTVAKECARRAEEVKQLVGQHQSNFTAQEAVEQWQVASRLSQAALAQSGDKAHQSRRVAIEAARKAARLGRLIVRDFEQKGHDTSDHVRLWSAAESIADRLDALSASLDVERPTGKWWNLRT